nr:immunoglobulin heavy chain junction region [Homo sapiens]
AEDTAVYYC